ncbi:N-acetylglucosamine kinase [Herbidospora daliensis]|uniref:N-acetylglucosamine kinase n=1 Tax=Herbidospora daliensis TaxID=295585 RepID=UPI00078523C8|nr:BadF/BadG/BcrA/BcrD ATPase family protein [Herbidospora daliensis]
MRTLLAVDGGNSKTDLALVAEDGTVLATTRTGPFLPQSAGVEAAVDVVDRAARDLLNDGPADVLAAYLAGADFPSEEEALRAEFLLRGCAKEVTVANDVFAVLRAGTSRSWGVAVVCGAGINAVGVGPSGETARFPALGRRSGDWGGGEELADWVLWHAARMEDGRGPSTALAELVAGHFGTATVEEVVLSLHFGDLSPARLHELVPGLFTVAAGGDPVAREVVARQAEEVAVMARVCLHRLGLLGVDAEVVLGGSVLTAKDPYMHGLIEAAIGASAPRARVVVGTLPPVAGAALAGLDLLHADESAYTRVRERFRRSE